MNQCLGCNKQFTNNIEYNNHIIICIFYIYNKLYNKSYSNNMNNIISDILEIINIFELDIEDSNYIYYKKNILLTLENEYILCNSFRIINNISNENTIIEYIYYLIKTSEKNAYTYKEIINFISELYHISDNEIINIINSYKISYSNFTF